MRYKSIYLFNDYWGIWDSVNNALVCNQNGEIFWGTLDDQHGIVFLISNANSGHLILGKCLGEEIRGRK